MDEEVHNGTECVWRLEGRARRYRVAGGGEGCYSACKAVSCACGSVARRGQCGTREAGCAQVQGCAGMFGRGEKHGRDLAGCCLVGAGAEAVTPVGRASHVILESETQAGQTLASRSLVHVSVSLVVSFPLGWVAVVLWSWLARSKGVHESPLACDIHPSRADYRRMCCPARCCTAPVRRHTCAHARGSVWFCATRVRLHMHCRVHGRQHERTSCCKRHSVPVRAGQQSGFREYGLSHLAQQHAKCRVRPISLARLHNVVARTQTEGSREKSGSVLCVSLEPLRTKSTCFCVAVLI